jgi:ABC-type phosphate transport system auxiliary subunit
MKSGNWIKSGEPWVWLNAAAVSACLLLVGGLLFLITIRGAGHFWPQSVYEFTVADAGGKPSRVVGQIREAERVPWNVSARKRKRSQAMVASSRDFCSRPATGS